MAASNYQSLSVNEAQRLLKQFDCINPLSTDIASPDALRHALLLVARQADYHMIGVCADTLEQGVQSLIHYGQALGYAIAPPAEAIEGPVYLKFNPKSGSCYADSYTGQHRGVLVSCQSAYETGINDMFGHLPLDLFS